jgi:hypothetical protein
MDCLASVSDFKYMDQNVSTRPRRPKVNAQLDVLHRRLRHGLEQEPEQTTRNGGGAQRYK